MNCGVGESAYRSTVRGPDVPFGADANSTKAPNTDSNVANVANVAVSSRARCSPHPVPGASRHPFYPLLPTVDLGLGAPVDNSRVAAEWAVAR